MLNPHNLSSLLAQVLTPNPLSSTKPISISLLSSNGQPLCSCTSESELNKHQSSLDSSNDNGNLLGDDDPIINGNGNGHSVSKYHSINDPENKDLSNADITKKNIQQQIDDINNLDDTFGNYINADLNPAENIKIISLLAFNSWKQYTSSILYENDPNPWLVVSFFDYFLYIYSIPNLEKPLLLLLVCDNKFPKLIAVKKLENLSNILSEKLKDY